MIKVLLRLIWGNRLALIGSLIIGIFVVIALAAPILTKHAPNKRTGNPHEYPSIIVKSAQSHPDGWIAKNLATDRRTMVMSKKPTIYWVQHAWDETYGLNLFMAHEFP